jgi:hypothetical protein
VASLLVLEPLPATHQSWYGSLDKAVGESLVAAMRFFSLIGFFAWAPSLASNAKCLKSKATGKVLCEILWRFTQAGMFGTIVVE